ncbi:MAG: hypothetical protein ACREGI_01130 [Candidatus Levyibacteriota bacterium]
MTIFFYLFFLLFLGIFFISHMLTRLLSRLLYKFTKRQSFALQLFSFLFLPGVIIHELAHFFVASILFVPTGEIEFLPVLEKDTLKLGSVEIGRSDPVRRLFIGVAPVLVGLLVMLVSFTYLSTDIFHSWQKIAILLVVLFEVGNTMFSSKKDLEGALGLVVVCALLGITLFLWGIRLPSWFNNFFLFFTKQSFFQNLDVLLLLLFFIDGMLIALFRFLLRRSR